MVTSTGCIVQHRYRVDPLDHKQLLRLLAAVRDHAVDLGLAHFEVWEDGDDPWQWTEVHHFDSWSQYQRLTRKKLDPIMRETYEALAKLQVGGPDAVETQVWTRVLGST